MKARIHFFYFRNPSILGDDDSATDSIMVPVENITGFTQGSDTTLDIFYKNTASSNGGMPIRPNNSIRLSVKSGTRNKVMALLAAATNGPVHNTGITIIADDVNSKYLTTDIVAVEAINSQEVYEEGTS